MHFQSNPKASSVFHTTPDLYAAAAKRHRDVSRYVDATMSMDLDHLETHLRDADVLVGFRFPRARLASRAPRLQWIHIIGAGVEHLLPFDWLPPGVKLVNNRGVHAPKAGEFAAMAILMLNNALPAVITNQRQRRWEEIFSTPVTGKTLVVVGVGQMGGAAARHAKRLRMHVLGVRRSGRPHRYVDEMFTPRDLQRILPRADFLVATTPLTRETHQLLGRRELDLLPPHAGLINMSRAEVIDYEALAAKLARGELSGALLDVFEPEPLPSKSPLWSTPRLIITPHIGSDDAEQYMPLTLDLLFDNVRRRLAGRPLRNLVDPGREY